MNRTSAFRIAALSGALAVGLGAFGAHALKAFLEQNAVAPTWQTAVFYHFLHTVVLLLLAQREPFPRGAWLALLAGTVLFSGSLYVYCLAKIHWLVFVTPVGGVTLIAGWLMLAFSHFGSSTTQSSPK